MYGSVCIHMVEPRTLNTLKHVEAYLTSAHSLYLIAWAKPLCTWYALNDDLISRSTICHWQFFCTCADGASGRGLATYRTNLRTLRTRDTLELGTLIWTDCPRQVNFLDSQPRISETNPLCFLNFAVAFLTLLFKLWAAPYSSKRLSNWHKKQNTTTPILTCACWVFKVTLAASLPVHPKQLLWDLQRFHTSWPENGSQCWRELRRIQRNNQKQKTWFILRWCLKCFVFPGAFGFCSNRESDRQVCFFKVPRWRSFFRTGCSSGVEG